MVEIPEGTRYRRIQYHLRKIAEQVEEIEATPQEAPHATSRGARIPQGWGVVAPSLVVAPPLPPVVFLSLL